jgi:molybdate transport system substrate-binding protein
MKIPRFVALFSCVVVLCFWLGSCTTPSIRPIALNIASGGILRDALTEVNQLYRQVKPNVVANYVFSGDRLLAKRVEQGEPFDLFISAAPQAMDELEQKGLILSGTRQPFVGTGIALIVPANSQLKLSNFADLADERVKTVAIALEGPGVSIYTKELLTNLGILDAVKRKAVLAAVDVREIRKAVESKQADAGITYLSEGQSSKRVKVVAVASSALHRPVVTTLSLLKNSRYPTETKAFVEFLRSSEAMAVFQKYGLQAAPLP